MAEPSEALPEAVVERVPTDAERKPREAEVVPLEPLAAPHPPPLRSPTTDHTPLDREQHAAREPEMPLPAEAAPPVRPVPSARPTPPALPGSRWWLILAAVIAVLLAIVAWLAFRGGPAHQAANGRATARPHLSTPAAATRPQAHPRATAPAGAARPQPTPPAVARPHPTAAEPRPTAVPRVVAARAWSFPAVHSPAGSAVLVIANHHAHLARIAVTFEGSHGLETQVVQVPARGEIEMELVPPASAGKVSLRATTSILVQRLLINNSSAVTAPGRPKRGRSTAPPAGTGSH